MSREIRKGAFRTKALELFDQLKLEHEEAQGLLIMDNGGYPTVVLIRNGNMDDK